jgi:hypothetical protein
VPAVASTLRLTQAQVIVEVDEAGQKKKKWRFLEGFLNESDT